MTNRKIFIHIFFYFLIFLTALVASPFFGSAKLNFFNIINNLNSIDYMILINQRIPRLITGMLCGAGLGVSGAGLQVILKNRLAEPYILGISGLSALFLTFSIVFLDSLIAPQLASILGALFAVLIIDFAFKKFRGDSGAIILTGVSINILSSSLILFLKYFATPEKLILVERWFMGSLDILGYDNLLQLSILVVLGILIILFFSVEINILGFDQELARTRGINPEKTRRLIYLATGLISASVVWIAGPIGFVGLIIPHIVRGISGSDMRIVLPGCAFLGGGFLVVCDLFSRILISPAELPVGIITAITGSPVFLIILFKFKNK